MGGGSKGNAIGPFPLPRRAGDAIGHFPLPRRALVHSPNEDGMEPETKPMALKLPIVRVESAVSAEISLGMVPLNKLPLRSRAARRVSAVMKAGSVIESWLLPSTREVSMVKFASSGGTVPQSLLLPRSSAVSVLRRAKKGEWEFQKRARRPTLRPAPRLACAVK